MRLPLVLLAVALIVCGPWTVPSLAAEDGPDFTMILQDDAPPTYDGPAGWFTLNGTDPGRQYAWTIDLPSRYIIGDIRIPNGLFEVDRSHQIVPMVNVTKHYPLFKPFPRDELWTANAPAQVYRYIDDGDTTILRVGFPGPLQGGFTLTKDTEPPEYEIGPVEQLTHFGFYQESTTDELTRADLRIRPADGGKELENPTPVFAFLQKFPVQGLDPETRYEAWIVFEDWAGNNVTSDSYTVTTLPRPAAPPPTISAVEPTPNATEVPANVTIRISIDAPTSESVNEIILFVDAKRVGAQWDPQESLLSHRPRPPLEQGAHRVSVEVYDIYGNLHHEQWRFWVGPGPEDAEASGPPIAILLTGLLALLVSRRVG